MPIAAQRGASTYLRPWLMNQSDISVAGPYCTKMKTAATTATAAQKIQNMISASLMPSVSRSSSIGRNQYTEPMNPISSQMIMVSMCSILATLKSSLFSRKPS